MSINNCFNGRKCIVFAIEHYNPLGVIRSLGKEGIRPIYIGLPGRVAVASSSKYISKYHCAHNVEEGYRILMEEYGDAQCESDRPLLFASDDKTVCLLDEHYDEIRDKFVFFNAGQRGRVSEYMDKNKILELARKHGLNILEARVCKRGEIPEDLGYPVITKSISPVIGGWKSDVHICHNREELARAYESIEAPTVLVQSYIEKENEYCIEGFSVAHGRESFFAIASTYNYLIPGYYSPYMTVRNMDNAHLQAALGGMLEEIGFEGIFEIEFLLDRDGTLYFSEINFRNSTWSWASTMAGMNLPVLWGGAVLSGKIPKEIYKPIPEDFIGMVEPIDYGKRVDAGKVTPAQWLADFKAASVTYYYDKDDLAPYYLMMENWEKLK